MKITTAIFVKFFLFFSIKFDINDIFFRYKTITIIDENIFALDKKVIYCKTIYDDRMVNYENDIL